MIDNNAKLVLAGPLLNESVVNKVKEEIKNKKNFAKKTFLDTDIFYIPFFYIMPKFD